MFVLIGAEASCVLHAQNDTAETNDLDMMLGNGGLMKYSADIAGGHS